MSFARVRPSIWLPLAAIIAVMGCGSPPAATTSKADGKAVEQTADVGESIRDELRKPADLPACRRLVDQVNASLPRASADKRPSPLSQAERAFLEKELLLRPEEISEVARPEYTPVDAHYLAEAILLRDIARSLGGERTPPVARAGMAVAWVARNFPMIPSSGPALPISFMAVRGAGTPIERTYMLLALARHLGLDAALIGDPGGPDGIWAVGVLDGGQIYLFDARLGLPLPGPDGAGVLTLAQARSLPEPFKPLAIDPKLPYDVTAERAKKAEIFVAAPLSALSPRMRFLQGMVGEDTVHLAADPAAQRDRFHAAGGPVPVRIECSPAPDAFPRLLFAFLPRAEGGSDSGAPGRLMIFFGSRIPRNLLPPFFQDLPAEAVNRVMTTLLALCSRLEEPGMAHDLILRGQFREATDQLVAAQSEAKRRPGNPAELTRNSQEWAIATREYEAEKARREHGRGDPSAGDRMEQNRVKSEELWKSPRGTVAFLEYRASDLLGAQATYLLALCKHEEAERLRDLPEARQSWSTAQHWWKSFLTSNPNSPSAPAAQRNLASALASGGQRDAARATYIGLAGSAPTSFDRLAARYLAESLK